MQSGCAPAVLEAVQKLKPLAQQAGCRWRSSRWPGCCASRTWPPPSSAPAGPSSFRRMPRRRAWSSIPTLFRKAEAIVGRRGTPAFSARAGRPRSRARRRKALCHGDGATVGRLLCLWRTDAVGRGRRRPAGLAAGRGRRQRSGPSSSRTAASWQRTLTAPLPLPPFTNFSRRRLCAAQRGSAGRRGEDLSDRRFDPGRRVRRPCRSAGPGHPHLHRRADAGRRRHGLHAGRRAGRRGRQGHPAARPQTRRQRPADRRGHRQGQVVPKAGHRLRPQDIALAAALGHTEVEVRRRIRVAVCSTGDEIVAPGAPRRPAQPSIDRFMLMAMLARLGCAVDDSASCATTPRRSRPCSAAVASHDLDPDVRRAFHGRGGLRQGGGGERRQAVFWRMAIEPGRPVAMGAIGGTPSSACRAPVRFATFAYLARPAILRCPARRRRCLRPSLCARPSPVPKESGRRICPALSLRQAVDDTFEGVKFPREGAGLLSSLVETDGRRGAA